MHPRTQTHKHTHHTVHTRLHFLIVYFHLLLPTAFVIVVVVVIVVIVVIVIVIVVAVAAAAAVSLDYIFVCILARKCKKKTHEETKNKVAKKQTMKHSNITDRIETTGKQRG